MTLLVRHRVEEEEPVESREGDTLRKEVVKCEAVMQREAVRDDVLEPEEEGEADLLLLLVVVAQRVGERVLLVLSVEVKVGEGAWQVEGDGVGDGEVLRKVYTLELPEPLELGKGVTVPDREGDTVEVRDSPPEVDPEAPRERKDEGERLTVLLAESVVEGVALAVGEGVPLPVTDPVRVALGVKEGVWEGLPLLDLELDPVLELEAPGLSEEVGLEVKVPLRVGVEVGIGGGVAVGEGVTSPVPVPL